jgi:NADPH-dependent 2,4-dienoyl-CoA reductase/sulfur reductase-like enzyme
LIARKPEVFRNKQNIDARVRHEVEEIDLERRRVRVHDLEKNLRWWEPFDLLHIATGARPAALDVSGRDADGIYQVGTLESGVELRTAVDEGKPQRAVLVGGGYVSLEMAEAFLLRGIEVAMVVRRPQPMKTLDPEMGSLVAQALRDRGVALYLEEELIGFEVEPTGARAGGRVRGVVTDQRTLPADIVVLGLGVRPNSALAAQAGVPLGVMDAIRVNERMETEIEGVWAAGDCVEAHHLVSRQPTYISMATVANKQGRVAGVNIAGGRDTFPGIVGTMITKFFDTEVARTGLQSSEAEALGLEAVSAKITAPTRSHYYPGAEPMTVKVVAEKGSGRFLGGQIVGGDDSAKRIDILATSLHAGFDVEEMLNLDLAYAPPFSQTWDPVLIAIRQVIKQV